MAWAPPEVTGTPEWTPPEAAWSPPEASQPAPRAWDSPDWPVDHAPAPDSSIDPQQFIKQANPEALSPSAVQAEQVTGGDTGFIHPEAIVAHVLSKYVDNLNTATGSEVDANKDPEIQQLRQEGNSPVVTLPKPSGHTAGAGIVRGLETSAEGLTTPQNLTVMAALGGAPGVVQKVAAYGFGAMMAKEVPDKISDALADPTPDGKAQKITEAIAQTAMAILAAKHGGSRDPIAAPERLASMEKAAQRAKELNDAGNPDGAAEALKSAIAEPQYQDESNAPATLASEGQAPAPEWSPPELKASPPAQAEAAIEGAPEPAGMSIGPGAASAAEDISNTQPATSLKRAVVDVQRDIDGRAEIPVPNRDDSKQLVSDAEDAITNNPDLGRQTVDRILDNSASDQQASPKDASVMLVERARLRNERAAEQERAVDPNASQEERDESRQKLTSIEGQIDRLDQASRSVGTAWSDFGRLYQQVIKDDYSLEALERKAIAAKAKPGEPMTRAQFKDQFPEEHAKLQDQAKRIAELEKEAAQKKADFENTNLDADTKAAYEATIEDLKKKADANGQKIEPRILSVAERIIKGLETQADKALERIHARRAEGRVNSLPVDDLIDYSIYGAAKIARKGLDFTKWSAEMISDIGDMSADVLKQVWDASNARIDELGKKTGKDADKVTKALRKKGPQTPVEAKAAAKAEAVAGEPLSHGVVFDYVKSLIQSGVHGVDPLMKAAHEGLKEHFPDLTERDVRRAFSEYGKVKFPSKEATARELAETRRITQLQESIDRLNEGKDALHTGLQRDKATQQVREKTKELNELLKKRPGPSSPEKLASRDQAKQTALRNAIADIDKQLRTGEKPVKGEPLPDSPETEQLRAERDAMKAKLDEIEEAANPGKTPEQRYNETRLKQVQKRTAELEAKVKANDYTKPPKPAPKTKYAEVLSAEAKLEKVKREFDAGVERDRLKNRTASQKFWDHFVGVERAMKLSSDVVLAKLTTAAIVREGVLTPAEELVGGAVSKVLPKLAARAPREGGLNLKAEAKAKAAAFTSGMKDAWDNARFRKSELENRFGSKKPDNPSWYEYFGYLHGALKAPIKRAEFERSLEKRIYSARKAGVDVNNVETMGRLAQESYVDAERAIFMQDNAVSEFFNNALSMAERSRRFPNGGPAIARIGRFLVPIVKVPTNIVGEVATGVHGVATGGVRAATAYIKGIDSLPPEKADAIMRQLKKGLVGNALLLTGYFAYQGIGGFYQSKETRDKSDVEADHFRVGKVNLPSFVSHSTAGALLNLGATFRRVDEKKGLEAGLSAALRGEVKQLPFVPAATNVVDALESDEKLHKWLRDLAIGSLIPSGVTHVAKVIDTPGNFPANALTPATKRYPTNDKEAVKAALPVLRGTVPSQRQKPNHSRKN